MERDELEKRELLDDLLTDVERGAAPSIDSVLGDVRREKHARANRRVMVGTLAIAALVGIILLRQPASELQPVIAVAAPQPQVVGQEQVNAAAVETAPASEASEWKIDRINDQELMDLLQDSPVALVKYPDGNRRLMMVVDNGGQ